MWSLCVHSPLSFRLFFFSVAFCCCCWAHVNPVIVSFAGGWMESRVRLMWETERHLWKCILRVFARKNVVLVSQYASSQRPSLHPPHPASPIHTHWRSRVVLLEERNSSFLCMALKSWESWEFPFLGSHLFEGVTCSRESLSWEESSFLKFFFFLRSHYHHIVRAGLKGRSPGCTGVLSTSEHRELVSVLEQWTLCELEGLSLRSEHKEKTRVFLRSERPVN